MATAAIKPSAEVACKLCRGGAVKTEGQQLKALKFIFESCGIVGKNF